VFTVEEDKSGNRAKVFFKVVNFKKGMQDPPFQYREYKKVCTIHCDG
jgi:hypothetical protein